MTYLMSPWCLLLPGAMENWGLVIYREGALLVDLEKSSSYTKEYVALIVGHELAHNWFGNLVTMVSHCPFGRWHL